MRDGLQVLLQSEEAGHYRCEGFVGLAIARPAQIIVQGSSPAQAALVRQATQELRSALLRIHPQVQSRAVPCGGSIPSPDSCHAFDDAQCTKVFVVVGDGTTPLGHGGPLASIVSAAHPHKVLALLPRHSSLSLLGPPFSHHQAQFFQHSPGEAVPAILAAAGLVSEERRLFISYRRRDAIGLAEQLFDALGREGFHVFLDSFSIPPGVDFHARLHQELADKTLVLVLESRNLSKSEWVGHELSFARAHRLGLLALHLPRGVTRPEIPEEFRLRLGVKMFRGLTRNKEIGRGPLSEVLSWILRQHERFIARRRYQLRQSMQKALRLRGIPSSLDSSGLLQVSQHGGQYKLWLTPRIPEPRDFHHTHQALQPFEKGAIIGPPAAWNWGHAKLLDWLEAQSGVRHFDEGLIRHVADRIQHGGL
jgi:hypothetical protein